MFEHLINLSFNKNSLAPCVYAAVLISIKKRKKRVIYHLVKCSFCVGINYGNYVITQTNSDLAGWTFMMKCPSLNLCVGILQQEYRGSTTEGNTSRSGSRQAGSKWSTSKSERLSRMQLLSEAVDAICLCPFPAIIILRV